MTTRYQKNLDIMTGWLENHPEHKALVSVLLDAGKAFSDTLTVKYFGGDTDTIKKTSLDISVGKAAGKVFYPYLTSTLKNPKVVVSSNDGIPEVVIDKTHSIDLSKVNEVEVKTESIKEGDYSFERFKVTYKLHDLDYMIHIVTSTK